MNSLEGAWQAVAQAFDTAQSKAGSVARAGITNELNQIARRLKQYKTEQDWSDAVLDGAARFAHQVALFAIVGTQCTLRGARGVELPGEASFALSDATAFESVSSSGDTIITLCAPKEVSSLLASSVPATCSCLIPISNGIRVVAILFSAGQGPLDTNALELIANIGSSVLERHSHAPIHVQIAPGANPLQTDFPNGGQGRVSVAKIPLGDSGSPIASLPDSQKLVHLQARRFARVKAAEIQLYRPEACHAGRENKDLFLYLKREIESARDTFRNQFMSVSGMVDYLHLELVHQLANNDEVLLGSDYPGQMV